MRMIQSNTAVSNIVGAVLILALIIALVGAAKMVYVPDMKKEAEASHMQNAIGDMQNIKAQVGTIQAASATGNGFSTSSPLELGGGSIPVIDPSSSSGTVTIDPAYGNFSITAYFNNGTAQNPNFTVSTRGPAPMGRLIYTANNHYYTDQQVNYECGLLVLSQYGGNTSISSPPISVIKVENDPNTTAIVAANPPRIIGSPQSLSSTGECNIRTTILPYSNVINVNKVTNVTLVVKSNYSQLWESYFSRMMESTGLIEDVNYNVSRLDSQTVRLWVQGNGLDNDIILSSIDSLVITQIDGTQPEVIVNPTATATPTQSPSPSPTAVPTDVPVATIIATPMSGTAPLTVNFQGSGTNNPTSYDWDFGDGSPHGSGPTVSHTYATADTYTVALIASNAGGSSAPATVQITANKPVATEWLYLTQSGTMSTSMPSGGTTTIYFPVLGVYLGEETWTSPAFATDYVIQSPADTYVYLKRNGLLTLITGVWANLGVVSPSGARTTIMSTGDGGLLTLELLGDGVSKTKMSMSQQGPITVPKGSHLELTVSCYSLVGLSSLNIYEGSAYPSGVSMSTPTYISVSDLQLSDTNGNPVSSIPQSGTLRIGTTVTDPFGTSDIKSVTLAVYSPTGSTIYGPTAMTGTATDTSSPPAWKKYQKDVAIGTGLSPGAYTVVVKATDGNGVTVSKTLQLPVS